MLNISSQYLKVSSIKADFKVVQGKPIVRGIKVWVRNQLDEDIDYLNVVFSEGNTSQKEIRPYFTKVEFDKTVIKSNVSYQSYIN